MTPVMPDPSTPFGARVARRLSEEIVVWLTTVGDSGAPQPNPVWFLWDGARILTYNLPTAHRVRHVARHAKVAMHFDGNGRGGDIVVITGTARVLLDEPPADSVREYVEKYRGEMARLGMTPAQFSQRYSTAIAIEPERVRGF